MTSKQASANRGGFTPQWQRALLTATGLALAITLAALLVFIWWHTAKLHGVAARTHGSESFAWGAIGLMNIFMIRLLAVLCGTAVMFGGVATAFFTVERDIKLSGGAAQDKASIRVALATASPGVVAVLAGAIVIGMAVHSRVETQFTPSTRFSDVASAPQDARIAPLNPEPWPDTTELDKKFREDSSTAGPSKGKSIPMSGEKKSSSP